MEAAELTKKIEQLCRPVVADAGFDLILVEWGTQQGRAVLRLYVDRPEGVLPSAVTLDDCASVSRQVSAVLDVEDVIHRAYSLEVSSPGLDRPLTQPDHYNRFAGRSARIRLKEKTPQGRKRFQGTICGADHRSVTLEVDGRKYTFSLEEVDRANLIPEC